ncbi:MAG: ATP-binding protein [Fervidobacterium sp.]|uniref:ATP-binding protein n=1 Tax=Fervidobacterium sp. TaxID=1871331 RepID=UPI004048FAFA
MKLKEIYIKKYGPLENRTYKLNNFTLFYGPNESGKTMTTEALIKLLVGKSKTSLKTFDGIERVQEHPDGYIILESNGKDLRIAKGEFLTSFGIHPEELRGILIVRNSDLNISEDGREKTLYSKASEKLTGSNVSKLWKLREMVFKKSVITESGRFKDRRDENYKEKYETARSSIETIRNLLSELTSKGYDKIEEQLYELRRKKDEYEKNLEKLRFLRKKNLYDNSKSLLDELKSLEEELSGMNKYSNEALHEYISKEKEIENLENRIEDVKDKLKSVEEEIRSTEELLHEKEQSLRKASITKVGIDDLKSKIYQYNQEALSKVDEHERKLKMYVKTAIALFIISLVLGALNWLVNIDFPILFKTTLAISSVGALLTAWLMMFLYRKEKTTIKDIRNREKEILHSGYSIFSKTFFNLNQVEEEISNFGNNYEQLGKEIDNLEFKKSELEKRKSEHQKTLNELIETFSTVRIELKELQTFLKINSFEELKEKIKLRNDLERKKEGVKAKLVQNLENFSSRKLHGNEDLSTFEDILNTFRKDYEVNNAIATENCKDELLGSLSLEEVESEYRRTIEQIQQLITQKNLAQNLMRDIVRKILDVGLNECVPVDNINNIYLADMEKIRTRLEEYIENLEREKQETLLAVEILKEIEDEEKGNINNLFEKSNLIRIFNELTDNKYTVEYDIQMNTVIVKDNSGNTFVPSQLSSGTYDQLYFSIRLALAEQLFGQEKAFFILDDPFIKYDIHRLSKQLEKLLELSRQGWQFVYFTAKDEVLETLENLQAPDSTNNALKDIQIYSIVDN